MKTFIEVLNEKSLITEEDFIEFINEIGDMELEAPEWIDSSDPDNAKYTMKTDKSEYNVDFACGEYEKQKVCKVSFQEKSGISILNRGEMFKVMVGLVNIIDDYVKKTNIKVIAFEGEYKEKEDKNNPSIRTRLYLEYVKKQLPIYFPNAHFRIDGNFVRIFF